MAETAQFNGEAVNIESNINKVDSFDESLSEDAAKQKYPSIKCLKNIVHIVESGTNGIWSYRKWSDGTAECWGEAICTVSSDISANDYSLSTIALPFTFVSRFRALITPSSQAWRIGRYYDLTDTASSSYFLNNIDICYWPVVDISADSTQGFMVLIKGTWK